VDVPVVAGAARNPQALIDRFQTLPLIANVERTTGSSCEAILVDGTPITFTAVAAKEFAIALHHHTGSEKYVQKMQNAAARKGFALSDRTLRRVHAKGADGPPASINVKSEAELFSTLDKTPSANCRDDGEVELALAGKFGRSDQPGGHCV
jgi:DNA polymerase/3'-5' exonuclease PolX